ncbi:hypothetical protein DFH07DRAFT_1012360 [Mycena maculata]|uniref:Uncharacterized protein n=1 Tax=Mycena maculata TaxID=230809 RepID=A0AAD7MHN1_9AGAR|nr:hypothetical protein DFH07DRAFT_1012360 [Mycena maculata]
MRGRARDYSSRHTNTTWVNAIKCHWLSGKQGVWSVNFLAWLFLLESPTNPLLKIADIAAISKGVKKRAADAIVVIDNTMNPYLPLNPHKLSQGTSITPNSTHGSTQ